MRTVIKNWCYEYVSMAELRDGLFQAVDINRDVVTRSRTPSDWLLARACQLAGQQHMLENMTRVWRGLLSALLLLLGIALVAGVSAGLASLGSMSAPVNVIWSLLGLILMPTVTLIVWLASLALRSSSPPWFGKIWQGATSRLLGDSPQFDAWQAWLALARHTGTLRVWLALVSHLVWLVLLLGSLAALIVAFSLRHYTFVWETTWLSVDVFVRLASLIGSLSGWLGFSMPDAATVAASGNQALDDAVVRMQWANWLVGSVLVLGVVPRLLSLSGCLLTIWGRYRRHRPDCESSYAKAVLAQIRHDSASGVSDGPPGKLDQWESLPVAAGQVLDDAKVEVVGLDLVSMPAWTQHWPSLGIVDDRSSRASVLDSLGQQMPARLLIVVDAGQTPDRGSISLARELAARAGQARVFLQLRQDGPDRSGLWSARLSEAGLPLLLQSEGQAQQWLRGAA